MPSQYQDQYEREHARLARQRAIAQAIQEQAMQPIESPGVPGAQTSGWSVLAKALQGAMGGYAARKVDRAEKENQKNQQQAQYEDINAQLGTRNVDPIQQTTLPLAASPLPDSLDPNAQAMAKALGSGNLTPGAIGVDATQAPAAAPPPTPASSTPSIASQMQKMTTPYQPKTGMGQDLMLQMALQKRAKEQERRIIPYGAMEVGSDGSVIANNFRAEQQESPFGKINAGEYTPESVQKFTQGGAKDYSLLVKALTDPAPPPGYRKTETGLAPIEGGPADPAVISGNRTPPVSAGPPSGYRMLPDGSLAFIPGGPADPKVAQKLHPPASLLAVPTGDSLDLQAQRVLNGETPSSRSPIAMNAVYQRAAEMAKAAGNTNQAALMGGKAAKANTGALNAVVKQYELIKPFANMAERNADVLEKAMGNLGDSVGPLLNTPIRALKGKLGDRNVAAFHAALLPVQADFARILNSPTGAGVLSDTARSEMRGALGDGATAGQIKDALDIFRTDANNRRVEYEASIADLTNKSVAQPTPGSSAIPAGVKVTVRNK